MTAELDTNVEPDLKRKLAAVKQMFASRPWLVVFVISFNTVAAMLEGVGLGLLIPVIEFAQSDGGLANSSNSVIKGLISIYELFGIPFLLQTLLIGIAAVLTTRYIITFISTWMGEIVRQQFLRDIQQTTFEQTMDARVAYFDEHQSEDIINAIITQAPQGAKTIPNVFSLVQLSVISLVYLGITVYIAPVLTLGTIVLLSFMVAFFKILLPQGYAEGNRVAEANEGVQRAVQASSSGIRDIKLYNLRDEFLDQFETNLAKFVDARVNLTRNKAAIDHGYKLATSLLLVTLIYLALTFSSLSVAGLGVFLLAMFRLAPKISAIHNTAYTLQGNLPHLVRTQEFTKELQEYKEPANGTEPVSDSIEQIRFENVSFSYETGEQTLHDVSFTLNDTEFAGFVGPSGAGKSTVASLLARLYEPDSGRILVNGTDTRSFDIHEWRSKLAVVRQHPYIFNDTLYYNLTVGNRDASREEVERICEIAQVTEFFDELPEGYDTVLGDNGVKLSGGQRQRVAVARALLCDAELLILDEATSDLDTTLEDRVHRAVETMERDYAMLVIAHRLSTVRHADCIYAMEDGEITEKGTHQQLVDGDGTYATLHAAQHG
jgi:subfamily B ATP-binding cassette protein MsbA